MNQKILTESTGKRETGNVGIWYEIWRMSLFLKQLGWDDNDFEKTFSDICLKDISIGCTSNMLKMAHWIIFS